MWISKPKDSFFTSASCNTNANSGITGLAGVSANGDFMSVCLYTDVLKPFAPYTTNVRHLLVHEHTYGKVYVFPFMPYKFLHSAKIEDMNIFHFSERNSTGTKSINFLFLGADVWLIPCCIHNYNMKGLKRPINDSSRFLLWKITF